MPQCHLTVTKRLHPATVDPVLLLNWISQGEKTKPPPPTKKTQTTNNRCQGDFPILLSTWQSYKAILVHSRALWVRLILH